MNLWLENYSMLQVWMTEIWKVYIYDGVGWIATVDVYHGINAADGRGKERECTVRLLRLLEEIAGLPYPSCQCMPLFVYSSFQKFSWAFCHLSGQYDGDCI